MTASTAPRVLLISQWPKIKNAEYELIEKIRKTGFKITVVDYLGFDVVSDHCINDVALPDEYDFAISFHYDTPKFLNLPTFLWVANPLEFMHFQGNYRTALIHHLRAYDDYLYNGSDLLKQHIKRVLGKEWRDTGLSLIGSCSHAAMLAPRPEVQGRAHPDKIFYCGINWERGSGKSGRAQGLLDVLQERQLAEFYGPRRLEGINPWEGFTSYRGEIPFDGVSMFGTMQEYGAVLAVSSPAHLKSKTASGRVFEGLAAGVPVISDDNPHIRAQFGDLIYYFRGNTEQERADSIQSALEQITAHPEEAAQRVRDAQSLIARNYSFEVCLQRILEAVNASEHLGSSTLGRGDAPVVLDLNLFHHDPFALIDSTEPVFPNLPHILRAIAALPQDGSCRVRLNVCCPGRQFSPPATLGLRFVDWVQVDVGIPTENAWEATRMGVKVELLAGSGSKDSDLTLFLTQSDFPQHDYLVKTFGWFSSLAKAARPAVHVAGFFVNDLTAPAAPSPAAILRNNASVGLYRWGQDSIAEHQLGQLCFNREAMTVIDWQKLTGFDVLFPVALLLEGIAEDALIHRSRHLLLRVPNGYFHRYYNAHVVAESKGFWALQYDLMSNYTHEINALYDAFHENRDVVAIADRISGHSLPRLPPPPGIDPAVHTVNYFLHRIRPAYRTLRTIWQWVTLSRFRKPVEV